MTAEIQFDCIHCGQGLVAEPAGAGLTTTCPKCRSEILVPEQGNVASRHADGIDGVAAHQVAASAGLRPRGYPTRPTAAEAEEEEPLTLRLERELAHARVEAKTLRRDLQEANEERESLRSSSAMLQAEVQRLQAENLVLRDHYVDHQQRLTATEAQMHSHARELHETRTTVTGLKAERERILEESAELERQNTAHRLNAEAAAETLDSHAQRVEELEQFLTEQSETLRFTEETRASLETERNALAEDNEILRRDLNESESGRELLELRQRIKIAERARQDAERAESRAEAEFKKISEAEQRQRGDMEALLRRVKEAEGKAESVSDPQLHKDNELLRGIVERQKGQIEQHYTELVKLRAGRFAHRTIWVIVCLVVAAIVAVAVQFFPELVKYLKAHDLW